MTHSCRDRARRGSARLFGLLLSGLGIAAPLHVSATEELEEIVVTARRLPERLGDVPLKITIVGHEELAAGLLDSMQSLAARTPGFYYETMWGGLHSTPSLRGQQAGPAGDPNVGVFVDGVYQANPSAIDPGVLDFERVEIVRGPQSALFGHSTFAGAIHYVTPKPSETPEYGFTLDAGSDDQRGAHGFVSGPLTPGVLARFALGFAGFDGTRDNSAPAGGDLDGWQRAGAALSLATPEGKGTEAGLTVRFDQKRMQHPAVSALTYADYGCGAVEALSGAWSYYCGDMPLRDAFDISTGIPDSESEVLQAALVLSWPVAGGFLESRTSFYRGSTDSYRDFDVSSGGEAYGVCTVDVNCESPPTLPQTVTRLTTANEVSRSLMTATEWSQEVRWQNAGSERLQWMLGATAWWTRATDEGRLGAARGDLTDNELLTALLPQSPFAVGPVSLVNSALVIDPNGMQKTRSLDESDRRTLAVFGTADFLLTQSVRARAELRFTRERRTLDNVIANFAPGFGTAIEPQYFDDVTPRFTVQYLPAESFAAWISAAKGSQSGGINPLPGLVPDEQVYAPEYNWTYELGIRYRSAEGDLGIGATAYYIDWRDTQLLGFPDSPGIANLITRNTRGLTTPGIELSMDARLRPMLRAELDLSFTEPAFRAGSDDPGSRRFCGISGTNETSTFCTVGPARSGSVAGLLTVPYIDGNLPARTPRRMWHVAAVLEPPLRSDRRLVFRVDANGQDDVFDRAIDGARFGGRTLFDARISYASGNWSVSLWGRNLGNESYIRAVASRGQVYFPTTPRPLDMLYGERRRFGLTVSYARRSGQAGSTG